MGNFSKDMEAIQKSKMEMSDMKNSVSEMKNYFKSFTWTQVKKELVNLKIDQEKLCKLKHKEKKGKNAKHTSKNWDNIKWSNT